MNQGNESHGLKLRCPYPQKGEKQWAGDGDVTPAFERREI